VLTIKIPPTFETERRYIIDVILGEFLGLQYNIELHQDSDYIIYCGNEILKIKDGLFGVYDNYLKESAIPKRVEFFNDLPIIYGENIFEPNYCGLDIFGSSFFMLARFEEWVDKTRDSFGRFPSERSLAARCGFEKKAVVNGYVELFWSYLEYLGFGGERKKWEFKIVPTHDIDHLYFYKNLNFSLTRIKKCIFKYRNFPQAFKEAAGFLAVKLKIKKDPYDRFEELMSISESYGVKSIFYFLVGQNHELDADFEIEKLKPIIQKIKKSGHTVALHPSFLSYRDERLIKDETSKLSYLSGMKIVSSRQHYLRFESPTTWQLLSNAGISVDSSLGYSDRVGFRCGCCYPYFVFDFINRQKLPIKESPLLVMDGTLLGVSKFEAQTSIESIIEEVKKYNGEFVFLWHNSSFDVDKWSKFDGLYSWILSNKD